MLSQTPTIKKALGRNQDFGIRNISLFMMLGMLSLVLRSSPVSAASKRNAISLLGCRRSPVLAFSSTGSSTLDRHSSRSSSTISVNAGRGGGDGTDTHDTHYFTCRHTYESTLMEELQMHSSPCINNDNSARNSHSPPPLIRDVSSPFPGLVKASMTRQPQLDQQQEESSAGEQLGAGAVLDPVYALQVLPHARHVHGVSIKNLAKGCLETLELLELDSDSDSTSSQTAQWLLDLPRGSLAIHAFVPDCLKGNPKPKMHRRVSTVSDEVAKQLKRRYACARKNNKPIKEEDSTNTETTSPSPSNNGEVEVKAILQLLLLSPEEMVVSLSPVNAHLPIASSQSWPNAQSVAGLANAEEDTIFEESRLAATLGPAPSSAYRKLMEAFTCMNYAMPPRATAVDLGASPGGWTSVLCKLGCRRVIAVDRSALDKKLMKYSKGVEFVEGDAFQYVPPSNDNNHSPMIDLMVSDIIAFPDRIVDLVSEWTTHKYANTMVVTMKFKGDQPDWTALRLAIDTAQQHDYHCRAKHFFNNKNEVSLMMTYRRGHQSDIVAGQNGSSSPWRSMYDLTLPQTSS
jgi:23S rRNA U2552 (ribose-2'-O)-methylase RlmE/FtsJ